MNWIIILTLGFEILYIAFQAARGQLSHYNTTSSLYSGLYALMGFAATVVSLLTAYVTIQFFVTDFSQLPSYYVWSIRIGLLLFVIFSLEGFVMGSRMAHTIGAADGGEGLPFLNWSRKFGDARVAHFVGMHALQVIPILSWYVLKDVKLTLSLGIIYALLACYVLIQALSAKPFLGFIK